MAGGRRWRHDDRALLVSPAPVSDGIISRAVWLYHIFSLSLRDVELILAERASWSPTRASGTGVGSSAPTSPGDCAGDDRRPAIRGTSTRCPSASRACSTNFGGPLISTASYWTSWCRI